MWSEPLALEGGQAEHALAFARVADARLGYFGTDVWDFTTDDRRIPIVMTLHEYFLACPRGACCSIRPATRARRGRCPPGDC